ncbi:HYR domain-containing protein, partial [candidate division KSB1 bacterium]|nr:HYR domain-containing protein [candidate division KSB1 bacterium]
MNTLKKTLTLTCVLVLLGMLFGSTPAPAQTFAYVTNLSSNNVSVIATASNTVVATVAVGSSPFGVAITPGLTNQPPDCSGAAIADQSADANCQATISGANVTGVTDPDGDPLTITVTPTTLVLGANTVTVTADDGNGGMCSIDITVNVVDNTAPVPDVTALPDATDECSVTLTAPTATDNCPGSITATTSDPTSYTSHVTFSVTWTYDDGNGNTSQQTQIVIVDDVTDPVITCPADITVDNDAGQGGAVVNFTVTATDNCDSNVNVVCTPASGSTFPVGTTTVSCTATDDAGNQASCSFDVTVVLNLVGELKVKELKRTSQRVAESLHLETFNTDPNLSVIWDTLFGVAPPTSSRGMVTLQADQVVTWEEGTLEMGGVMKLDVKTDKKDPTVKKVKISKAGKKDGTTTFVSGDGGVNPNLADGGWHEVKIKNMLDITVSFDGETVTGLLKELKVKLDKNSTTAAPVVKDFKIDITGVTTAADVKKGTVTSVVVTIPATTVTALATTDYDEELKHKPEVLGGHTEAEFKRAKNAVTEGVDIASLSDGFNDQLKERKGPCSISAAPVSLPKLAGTTDHVTVQETIPEGYALEQNYPNPFNP